MEMVQACTSVQKMEICHIRVPSSPPFAHRHVYKEVFDPEDPKFLAGRPSHHFVVPVSAVSQR